MLVTLSPGDTGPIQGQGINFQLSKHAEPGLSNLIKHKNSTTKVKGRVVSVFQPKKPQFVKGRCPNNHAPHRKAIKRYRIGLPVAREESFKVMKKLGNGNSGQVYLVENEHHQRFALKMVKSDPDLRHECAVMLRLKRSGPHRNLINVTSISPKRSDSKYLLMELGGSSLHNDLKRGAMEGDELCDSFVQIIKGASAIEQAGLQHNDLKPENILIDSEGCLKICDFGLTRVAYLFNDSGTLRYKSPEKVGVIESDCPDKSDSWALGCIFAEMRLGYPILMELEKLSSPPSRANIEAMLRTTCEQMLYMEGTDAADLFGKLTEIDPNRRISPGQALEHPYFKSRKAEA